MNKYLLLILVLIFPSLSHATQITYTTTYAPNGQVTSTNLNGNFATVSAVVNGKIDNTNIDTTSGYFLYKTVAVLPAAGTQGAVYFLTSDNSLNFDTGSSFVKAIAPSGSSTQGAVVIIGSASAKFSSVGIVNQPLVSGGAGADAAFGNVSGAYFTSLSSISSGAGIIPVANIGALVGATTNRSFTTVYQAATDGQVCASGRQASGNVLIQMLTDSSNPPTTNYQECGCNGTSGSNFCSCGCVPVKKNNFYEAKIGSGTTDGTNDHVNFVASGS